MKEGIKIFWSMLGIATIGGLTIYFFIKYKLLANSLFWTMFFIILFITGAFILAFKLSNPKNKKKEIDTSRKFTWYVKRVNELVKPVGWTFIWDRGDSLRLRTRKFGSKTYKALVGMASTGSRKGVIYSVEEDDIVDFIGDTYRLVEGANPFHGFIPTHTDKNNIYADHLKYENRRQYPQAMGASQYPYGSSNQYPQRPVNSERKYEGPR